MEANDMSKIEIHGRIDTFMHERLQAMKLAGAIGEYLLHAYEIAAPRLRAACEQTLDMALALAGDRSSKIRDLRAALGAAHENGGAK